MRKLLHDGVDGIISNYPERVNWVARELAYTVGHEAREARPWCLKKGRLPGPHVY